MKTNVTYQCEICEHVFTSLTDYEKHESLCDPKESFTCDKCGKKKEWSKNSDNKYSHLQQCHYIELGRLGYGSGLDGCDVNFRICDECLIEFIDSFTLEGQEKVLNSGSNWRMPSGDWIREAKGEFTDEDYESYGMYSPRQIKAYQERYPVCNKVVIYETTTNGDVASECICGAFGDGKGDAFNDYACTECFGCIFFEERKLGERLLFKYM